MDCTEFLNRYSEYDDSLVPPAEADRFRAHMAVCEACLRYDRVLRKGRMLARQTPGVEPSDDFVPRLRVRLSWQERGRTDRVLRAPAQSASALAAVTVLLTVIVALGLLMQAPDLRLASTPRPVASVGSGGSGLDAGPSSRIPPRLPAVGLAAEPTAPRDWAFQRVDRTVLSSYSPLIVGPPAYRGARSHSEAFIFTSRTLD